jgi:hypothetical protein
VTSQALAKHGVSAKPAISLNGNLAVPAGGARKASSSGGLQDSEKASIVIGVCVGVGGFLLLAALTALFCRRKRQRARKAAAVAGSSSPRDVEAAADVAGGADQGPHGVDRKAGKHAARCACGVLR